MESSTIYFVTDAPDKMETGSATPAPAVKREFLRWQDLDQLPASGDAHQHAVYLFQVPDGQWSRRETEVRGNKSLNGSAKIVLLGEKDWREYSGKSATEKPVGKPDSEEPGLIVLRGENQDPLAVMWLLNLSLQLAHYRLAAREIEEEARNASGVFDKVFELARQEQLNEENQIHAYEALLDYEHEVRRSERNTLLALENLERFRDKEIGFLHEQLEATQQLNEFRDREMKDTLNLLDATMKVLSLARREEMEMNRIIQAQDNLRQFTDQEIRELLEENQRLKTENEALRNKKA